MTAANCIFPDPPQSWLTCRTRINIRSGMSPVEAYAQALLDWDRQSMEDIRDRMDHAENVGERWDGLS